jgi:hypothetical protein
MEHKWKKDQEQDSDTSPTDEPQKKKWKSKIIDNLTLREQYNR